MELTEANKLLRSIKAMLVMQGFKIPPQLEADGIMALLGKIDAQRYLSAKLSKLSPLGENSPANKRAVTIALFMNSIRISSEGMFGDASSAMLSLLHKNLYGDIYDDAGHFRTTPLIEDGNEHTAPNYIIGSLKTIFSRINDIGCSPHVSKDDFASYLTHYMHELIILCPFKYGSYPAILLFMSLFAAAKGFSLYYYRIQPKIFQDAIKQSFFTDDVAPLYKAIITCLSYASLPERSQKPKTRRELKIKPDTEIPVEIERPPVPQIKGADKNPLESAPPDIIKKAVKIQHKITKLNDQYNALVEPFLTKKN